MTSSRDPGGADPGKGRWRSKSLPHGGGRPTGAQAGGRRPAPSNLPHGSLPHGRLPLGSLSHASGAHAQARRPVLPVLPHGAVTGRRPPSDPPARKPDNRRRGCTGSDRPDRKPAVHRRARLLPAVTTVIAGAGVAAVFAAIGLVASAALPGLLGHASATRASAGAGAASAAVPTSFAARFRVRGDPSGRSIQASLRAVTQPPAGTSIVARARSATVSLYHRPGGAAYQVLGPLPYSYGTPLAFLVVVRRPGWVLVQLPIRPNQSTAWVEASQLLLATTQYHLTADLGHRLLTVSRGTQRILQTPIGVGRSVSPTPSGRYYLVYLLRPPADDPVFGPYAFGLSAYSNVYSSFAGGDGEIGLHGTDDPSGIGHYVSHGCIRLPNPVITRLAQTLPLGTPITITH